MNYFSVCDGIGAAHAALLPLGNSFPVPVVRWIGERILREEGRNDQ